VIVELTGKAAEAITVLYVGTATYDQFSPKEKQTQAFAAMGATITE
jgi:hypothetical protein